MRYCLETLLLALTPIALISYLIRVVILFAVGGFVAILNRGEDDPFKVFQLGIAAPALITAFINGNNVTILKTPANPHAAISTIRFSAEYTSLIPSTYAQASEQKEIKKFSLPKETAIQQFYRGILGSTPKNVWFVIAGSHLKEEDAERQAQQLRAKGFSADVYAPYGGNPYYAVVIGAQLTLSEAQQLRLRAINAGLPKDTYLWTFPSVR